jgi:2-iminobutanoate/2-iminopropanoate deaminase
MSKEVIRADVPETGGPFNLCVKYGNLIFISGLPPFAGDFAAKLREARAKGQPVPPFPDLAFDVQVRIVMDHLKKLVEAAGSNMDCLLKVIVWPADQRQRRVHRIYRGYFTNQTPAGAHADAGRPH